MLDSLLQVDAPEAPTWTDPIAAGAPVVLATLGCKVNQYETQYVRELLLANGYRPAAVDEPAKLAVVNTCTVTSESDRQSRKVIRRLAKDHPGVKIIVMGCYATADPDVVRRLPGVVAVITDKRDLLAALRPFGVRRDVRSIRQFAGHHRAFVKVQDGCILQCRFCIIPKVRPGLLSRTPGDILDEVQQLVGAGFREIVLAGIHLGHYGLDLSQGRPRAEWTRLSHLLRQLCQLPGEFRIRLSSLEVTEMTDDLVAVLADHSEKICPHLHLSLQSGSDAVLRRMRRRYQIGKFRQRVELIKRRLDQPAFTTDLIVGFPGETEADVAATAAVVREVGFSKLHLFPFSARKGTEAADFTDVIAPEVIKARRERLAAVETESARQYHRSLLGRTLTMLVESPDPQQPAWMRGTACRSSPLRLRAMPALAGQLVSVRAAQLTAVGIAVEPIPESAAMVREPQEVVNV